MIYINNLSISNDTQNLNVDIETNLGSNITSILLWNDKTFKDYSQAIDISFKLEQVNNKEIFILNTSDINIGEFSGIWFLEIVSNHEEEGCVNCQNSIIGIAANLNNIKTYLLNEILKLNSCNNCDNDYDNVINTNLILKAICTALSLGYYEEAIYLYKKISKMLGSNIKCKTCKDLVSPTFINGLNYGILNNSLILI